ncbi:MAG: arginase, partial [Pseudomonadota bacterium]
MSKLVSKPDSVPNTFLGFPFVDDLEALDADIAILGIPYGKPYGPDELANDQSRAPDAVRQATLRPDYMLNSYNFDFDGTLLGDTGAKVVDCGNVIADMSDPGAHYR